MPMSTERPATLSPRRLALRRWTPYALLVVGCVLSTAASWYVAATARDHIEAEVIADETKFKTDAEKTRQQIEFRLATYIEVVRAGAALIGASAEINGAEFRAFVRGLDVRERYPGMIGIGFAPRVPHRNLSQFRRSVTLDSPRTFRMWPSERRAVYYPVLFLEPVQPATRASIGFNLSTDAVLSDHMVQARDSGQPTISGVLDGEPFGRAGRRVFLLLIPVYRPGVSVDTVDGRLAALTGFVFSPLSAALLLDELVTNASSVMSLAVYDSSLASQTNLLAGSIAVPDDTRFQSTTLVEIAGRKWLVVMKSRESTLRIGPQAANGTLLTGLLLSVLVFFITSTQVRAWETAARHEAELRASAQALRESEAQAQAADRAKDEFLATLSHELRTPLNAILGWVSMLRHQSVREDRRAHGLAVIERNARHQAHLIEDLLDVSRIVMGKVRLQMRSLPIAPVISAAVESLRPGAVAKGVHLHTSLTSAVIRGDADRIQQVVWNLVANAIKFTPAGGHVTVQLTPVGHHARISVRDTGIGIDPAFLPHVFERFRQADSSTTRPHTGIGIGLSIVQHLVELHGGSIEVRSEGQDHGAEFLIHVPLEESTPARPAMTAPAEASVRPAAFTDGVRVLLVDDDPDTRELLTEVLHTLGANVTAVGSARHAMERLTMHGADVVVSDISMPEEDGFSLIQRIRHLPGPLAEVPAIALTAFARADDRARAIEAGFQMHLTKPVELNELLAGLAALTSHQQAGRDATPQAS